MKYVLFLISTFLLCNLSAQTRYPETFHDTSIISNSFGYWTFEMVENYQIRDLSTYQFHGYLKDSVKYTSGRKLRYYPSYYNPQWQDSTGITRTAIDLNGGFGLIEGIPFESNKELNERMILSFWVEIKQWSNGVVFSLGDSTNGDGLLVDLETDLDSNFKLLQFSLLRGNSTKIKHDFKVLPLGWYWFMIDISPEYSSFKIRHDNHGSDTFINSAYTFNYTENLALPLRLGYSGTIAFGKNIFTGFVRNNHITIDDFLILSTLKDKYYWFGHLFDPANGTQHIIKEQLKIHPNPCFDFLNIESLPVVKQKPITTYKIIQYNGKIVQEGLFSETIDVSELSSGVYVLKIGSYTQKFIKI